MMTSIRFVSALKKKTIPVHFVIRVTQNVDVAGI